MKNKTTIIIIEDDGIIKETIHKIIDANAGKITLADTTETPSEKKEAKEPSVEATAPDLEQKLPCKHMIETHVTDLINAFGFSPNLRGYQFLRNAIVEVVYHPEVLHCVSKKLYPVIANEFGTKPCSVERNIRNAIEVVWDRGNKEMQNNLFSYTIYTNRKPTNLEFIAVIADKVRLEHSSNE